MNDESPDFIPAAEFIPDSNNESSDIQSPKATQSVAIPDQQESPDFIPADEFESDEEKYQTTGQQLKTGAEGLAKGLIGSIPTTAIETGLLGVKPEEIQAREEANPGVSGVSQAVGMGAGLLTGLGEAGLALKAGSAAQKALTGAAALETLPMATRIGAKALQEATEMAILTSDDEIAKMIWHKPQESADSAIANIGLAAAIGGAGGAFVTGAVSPLWKATVGPKVEGFLSSMTGKMGGKADDAAVESVAKDLFNQAGLDPAIAPSLLAKIDGNKTAEDLFSTLSQRDTTKAGKALQEELTNLQGAVGEKVASTFGKDKAAIENLDSAVDKYSRGQKVGEELHKELETQIKPISDAYDAISERFKSAPLTAENRMILSDDLAKSAISQGWHKAADDTSINLMKKVMNKLPEQMDANDLKVFMTNLRKDNPFGSPGYQAAKTISNAITDAQERSIVESMGAQGADVLAAYNSLRGQYKDFMGKLDNLNEHLHVGKYFGPQSFLNNLKEMAVTNPEGILSRLSGSSKADTLKVLSQFPAALANVKDYQIDLLLKSSKNAAGDIDVRKFSRQFEKLSPQIKELVAGPGEQAQLKALGQIIEKTSDSTHNWSNTARTIDKLGSVIPSPLMMLASLTGHAPAAVLSYLAGAGIKEGTDAARLSMLKFLGSSQPVNPTAFKSMVQYMDAAVKGEMKLNKAVDTVFKGGSLSIFNTSARDIQKLERIVDKHVADNGNDLNEKLINNETNYYLPDHQPALAATTVRAIDYLKTLKPEPKQVNSFNTPIPPTKAEEYRYKQALEIAQNPLVVLEKIKTGQLQTNDIKDLSIMYPAMYKQMQQKIMSQVVNRKADEEPVPYRTRLSISLFVQQPLDSTMEPASIMAAQPKPQGNPQQEPNTAQGVKKNTSKLGKTNDMHQTASQAAESNRKNHN